MVTNTYRWFTFLIFLTLASHQTTAQLNIGQLLSYPYPSNLCSHPETGRLAWTFNIEGRQNIYLSADNGKSIQKLTDNLTDDGQVISQLQFSSDGEWLVYIVGGEPGGNWSRDVPVNPNSSVIKRGVELRSMRIIDGKKRLLAKGVSLGNIDVSTKDQQVAFLKNEAIWTVPVNGEAEAKQLFYARGSCGWINWSPAGDKIAFVSDRGDHSFIGVFDKRDSVIKWIDPSFSMDVSPKWSPEGTSIAFVRLAAEGGQPDSLLATSVQSWQIRIANLANTGSTAIWQSPKTVRGSVPTTQGKYNLHWAAGDRIIFLSSMDNWPHLYAISAAGGEPSLLTPGKYMVEYVALSPDKKYILFSANTGKDALDIDRRHIGIVSVDRPGVKLLTSGDGIEVMPVFLKEEQMACISSTPFRPAMPTVVSATGKMTIAGSELLSPIFSNKNLVRPKQVTFLAPDGTRLHGQLFKDEGRKNGRSPAIVYIHGGPKRQMLLGWHFSDYYAADYAVNQALAKMGFIVLSVNYRLGIGYGNDFNQPPLAGRNGASEYQDILAAGQWLSLQSEVDPKRIGVYGGSYGGYLTALALGKNSDLFAAGVDIHGVHSRLPKERFTTPFEAAPDAAFADSAAWKSSPVAYAGTWKSPVLFIHGDDDRNVGFAHTINLLTRLNRNGVHCETLVIPDDTHHWLLHRNLITVCAATINFLQRMLQPEKITRN